VPNDVATIIGAAGAGRNGVTIYMRSRENTPFAPGWYSVAEPSMGSLVLAAALNALRMKATANVATDEDGRIIFLACNAG